MTTEAILHVRRTSLILACTILAASIALAQPVQWRPPIGAGGGNQIQQVAPESATVNLILEFTPASAGPKVAAQMTQAAFAVRRDALSTRVGQLQNDLAGLNRSARVTPLAIDTPRVVRTFHRVLFGASVRVPRELREAIRLLPYVASVHEDRWMQPLWQNVSHINADKAWARANTRGRGIVVAVIDSGIDYTHPALGGGFGKGFKVAAGWDFVDNDADPMDVTGHGTHVAGIIAADGAGLVGVAPDVTLYAYRVIGSGGGRESDVIAAIERAVDPDQNGDPSDHVDVVNMSLGAPIMDGDDLVTQAVERATAAGIVFCIAAGNDGAYGTLQTPGNAPSAITVGASDERDQIADFSSRGPDYSFGIKPEVVGPGVNILSSLPGGRLAEESGTSMAAPHVAGVAALVKAVHPDWTPAQIKSAIDTSALPLDEDVMAAGAGRVDALSATTVDALVSPSIVSFGAVDPQTETWSATRVVVLRNVSAETQTLSATVAGARDGIIVRVTPPAVTLPPGQSANVSVDVTVTNSAVPAPTEGSLSFGGRITWSGGKVPIHVPWGLVKGAFINITSPDAAGGMVARVFGTNSTDTLRSHGLYFYSSIRVFWPLEKVDIVVEDQGSITNHRPERVFIAEQADLAVSSNVFAQLSAARFTIQTDLTDVQGLPLAPAGGTCIEQVLLAFPKGQKAAYGQFTGGLRPLYTPFSDRVKVHLTSSCSDTAHSTVYFAQHEPFMGLHNNVTSTMRPQWLRQDVRFDSEGPTHLTEACPSMVFTGSADSYYFSGCNFYLMRPTDKTLTVYFVPSGNEEAKMLLILERWGHCPEVGPEVECAFLANAYLYLNENEVAVDGDLYLDISPMAYRMPVGTGAPLLLGAAPVWPNLGLSTGSGSWVASADWYGPLAEGRPMDARNVRTIVRDAGGNIIGDSSAGPIVKSEPLSQGVYTVESTDNGYAVGPITGIATATVRIDTSATDPYPPRFTGLRIVDEAGRQTGVVKRGKTATLLFSAADLYRDGPYLYRRSPRDESTRVEYRSHGAGEWKPLTPQVRARQYLNSTFLNGGVGTVYEADLSLITRDPAAIDLRLTVEDSDGNPVELRVEPAFVVVDDEGRRRSIRH